MGTQPNPPKETGLTILDVRSRERVAEWLKLRTDEPNITNRDAAQRLGIHPSTLSSDISKALKDGWLKLTDPLDQVEHLIIPKVLENLNYFLDARDQKVTIETAKGTIFKVFQDSKGINDAPQTVLAIKMEQPDTSAQPRGKIVGRPRIIEGEVK